MSAPPKNSKNRVLGKKVKGFLATKSACRGIFSIVVASVIWEFGTRYGLPILKAIPPPSAVLLSFKESVVDAAYWGSWGNSFMRIGLGFIFAQIIGIPLGLLMGTSRYFRELSLPVFEVLRPIPPLAWVPASALFWPTPEMSIVFVTFLGAFFVTILNIVGGARSIDARYIRAAVSLGSNRKDIFWRIVLPATLPSIIVALTVGIGVCWNTVVAAEMLAGHSGLGFLTWRAYVTFTYPLIVVGMISIGIAGYISSAIIRIMGNRMTPWLKTS
ncbi:MAG: ABC transporter permease [Desulfobaccales bacterium]